MAQKKTGIIGLSMGMIVSAALWLPAAGFACQPYAQDSSGTVLTNSAGECWQSADGAQRFCGTPPDMDGDGVLDDVDQCPNTRGAAVEVDATGCLVDSDRDGVPNLRDRCPGTKYGVRVDFDGCDLDLDGDGVPYYRDLCQTTPPGFKVDSLGCMVKVVLGDVLFHTGRADLTYGARRQLDRLAAYLRRLPDLEGILVIGYTDDRGSAASNQRLSENRARSVTRYLQSRGVSQPIVASGLGEGHPVASNATAAGRRLNRRVEIELERSGP